MGYRFLLLCLVLLPLMASCTMIPQWPKQFTSFWRTALVPFDEVSSTPPWNVLPNSTSGANFHSFTGSTFYDFTGSPKKMFQRFPSIAFSGKGKSLNFSFLVVLCKGRFSNKICVQGAHFLLSSRVRF